MIEVRRDLYMDEKSGEEKNSNFNYIKKYHKETAYKN